jgi:hypothetical protein
MMAPVAVGKTLGDLGGPDLGAVGNVARASKQAIAAPQELMSFSVKKGDNGGVLVCETYEKKAPEGRRASSYPGGGDYKENPFSPDDGAAAMRHITTLLGQMGVSTPTPEPEPGPIRAPIREPAPPPPPPRPPMAAVARGPNAVGAAVRRPGGGGGGAMMRGPGLGY